MALMLLLLLLFVTSCGICFTVLVDTNGDLSRVPLGSWKACRASLLSNGAPVKACCVALTCLGGSHSVCPPGQYVTAICCRNETDNPCQELQEARVMLGSEQMRFEWISRVWTPVRARSLLTFLLEGVHNSETCSRRCILT